MKKDDVRKELDTDLQSILDNNQSFLIRLELLLIQIIRLLKKKP